MPTPFLRIGALTKTFGDTVALSDVSLEVGADELLVVLGPTGAGKTTLLRTLAGLEQPDSGRIEMGGEDVSGWPPAPRDVALVFQNFSLYPRWTVRRNLEFPLKAPGRAMKRDAIRQRCQWAAELLGIGALMERSVKQLSGGQMQRVAIGRAIVRRPRIFLMDEPLTNLDAKLRESLRFELVCLRRELGVPLVFVTHDQAEALSMGDRIAVLSEGRILQSGTPEEVYRRPASPAVARQLGQPRINIFQDAADLGFPHPDAGQPGKRTFGVRPEDIEMTGGTVPATVSVVEDMGPSKVLLVDWLGQKVHIVADADAAVRVGDRLHPRPRPDRIIVWEA